MATKTFEELKQLAIQIRDEKTNKANTATRIGTQMIEHLNKLEQEYYNIQTVDGLVNEYNVSVNHPNSGINGSNKYTLSSAIALVPEKYRTIGLKCSFLNEKGIMETWEWKGGSWSVSNFKKVGASAIEELEGGTGKYLQCLTAQGTASKVVNDDSFKLKTGVRLLIKMSWYNSAASPSLNINKTGAYPIYYGSAIASPENTWQSNEILDVTFDGAKYLSKNYLGGESTTGQVLDLDSGKTQKEINKNFNDVVSTLSDKNMRELEVQVLGKSFIGGEYKNIQDYTISDVGKGNINSTGLNYLVNNDSSNYRYLMIFIGAWAGQTIKIEAPTTNRYANYAFLTNNPIKSTENGQKVSFVESQTQIQSYVNGGNLLVPNDALYMYLSVSSNGDSGIEIPTMSIVENENQGLVNRIEVLENNELFSINVLLIGNSFASDAIMYVPFVLKSIIPNIKFTIGLAHIPGSSLEQQYNAINGNTNSYSYVKITEKNSAWNNAIPNTNIETILNDNKWDIISVQQVSDTANDYSTYQPYLNNIIKLLFDKVSKPVRIGFLMGQSTGSSVGFEEAVELYFQKQIEAINKVLEETPISFFYPIATAIQNARSTSLDSLGAWGHLGADAKHLNEGVPCLIAAYTVTLKILELYGLQQYGIYGDKTLPTQEWINERNIFEQQGTSVGAIEDNVRIGQMCAVAALKYPLKQSVIAG